MNWRAASLALLVSSFSVLACGQGEDDDEDALEATEQPVIGGATTYERPEIGRMFFEWGTSCTATLVAPRVALAAAHGLKYRTRTARGDYGSIQFAQSETGPRHSFRLERFRSFGKDLGNGDVALVQAHRPRAVVARRARADGLASRRAARRSPSSATGATTAGSCRRAAASSGATTTATATRRRVCARATPAVPFASADRAPCSSSTAAAAAGGATCSVTFRSTRTCSAP